MRIALFGAGSPLSIAVRERLRDRITAVVLPRGSRKWTDGTIGFDDAAGLDADLFVVASFPHLLSQSLISRARHGAVNLHPSLLPRRRGPDPLFWTYYANDRDAGITLHRLTDRVDAGDIIAQSAIPLERGRDVVDLYDELAKTGAELLASSLDTIDSAATPQDESLATKDPRSSGIRIDHATWPCERVWHVVSGLGSRRNDLLPFTHGRALSYQHAESRQPGTVEGRRDGVYRVHCADGYVDVTAAPLSARIRRVARQLFRRSANRSQSR